MTKHIIVLCLKILISKILENGCIWKMTALQTLMIWDLEKKYLILIKLFTMREQEQ